MLGETSYSKKMTRDAVHVATIELVAREDLKRAQRVGVFKDREGQVLATPDERDPIGIVDPFLDFENVRAGKTVTICLMPKTVVNLRHDWLHPKLEDTAASVAFLTEIASRFRMSYSEFVEKLEDGYVYTNFDTPDINMSEVEEMWGHFAIVTGKDISDKSTWPFSCGC